VSTTILEDIARKLNEVEAEISKVVIGQSEAVRNLLSALLSDGHILIEGVPGLGKTLLANALAHVVGGTFRRIQFTPDLMPSDIIGTTVFNSEMGKFLVKKGPVFTNILLADEINRAPAKTQSALLEAMQEKKVTIEGTDYSLDGFFICLATQNPIEMEGTYPLPEAQIDRFLMKIFISYPLFDDEQKILAAYREGFKAEVLSSAKLKKILEPQEIAGIKEALRSITVDDRIIQYITEIVSATRNFKAIEIGASPRGSIALLLASRVNAMIEGRNFVIPDDVKNLVCPVLRHRIILDSEAEIDGYKPDEILKDVVEKITVPR
jgi:MoxR-like ATPase